MQGAPAPYAAPQGRVGRRFVALLTADFTGARLRQWNSERPLVFALVVLQRAPGVIRARDIRRRLENRMTLWEERQHAGLVDDTEAESRLRAGRDRMQTPESKARAFNAKVLSGRLRAVVRDSPEEMLVESSTPT